MLGVKKNLIREKHRHPLNVRWSASKPHHKLIFTGLRLKKTLIESQKNNTCSESQHCFFHQDAASVKTNVQNIFSARFLLVTVFVFENMVIMIPI